MELSDTESALGILAEEVTDCKACPRLVSWREEVAAKKRLSYKDSEYWGKGVPGFGDPEAKIMIIGLAPGAHGANRTGRMFTGDRSGDWLYAALYRAGLANQPISSNRFDGLKLNGVYISSPVKCVPPENKPTVKERDQCQSYLDREIEIIRPSVFIALGKFAFDILQRKFEVSPRAKFAHGLELPLASPVIPANYLMASYHVSQQNTFTGKLTEKMLDDIFAKAILLAES